MENQIKFEFLTFCSLEEFKLHAKTLNIIFEKFEIQIKSFGQCSALLTSAQK